MYRQWIARGYFDKNYHGIFTCENPRCKKHNVKLSKSHMWFSFWQPEKKNRHAETYGYCTKHCLEEAEGKLSCVK